MQKPAREGYELRWVPAFRHAKTGKLIVAAHYGKVAFPIWVKVK